MPAWCVPIRPSPNSGLLPNGVGNVLMLKSQIKPARLFRMLNSAINATIWLSTGALCKRPEQDALDQDAADKRQHDRADERDPIGLAPLDELPGDKGREHRHFALGEIQMVDRLVDHHDRQRHRRIDRPGREPRQDLLQEEFHPTASVAGTSGPRAVPPMRIVNTPDTPGGSIRRRRSRRPARPSRCARFRADRRARPCRAPAPRSARRSASPRRSRD